ncbi:MAG: hypothetical protein VB080_02590 [Propionicimonas sp.]|uniref:hypothetical protein n=1 Tax=Propionicimonas sp. TaxID=1955623 RepID=UPI002B220499|nr:hypothetical protein [Propionicimonas sp.]MEA4943306.1 hypothetical protein [Propionicimonas sp.]MEA5054405.1 hypothetical protein [Propionicimonas sp.]MEA5117838.1 hypothetical protein [Propionicimonas sp.]
MDVLHVDCGSCRARGPACSDCVISVLLGPVASEVELDADELGALSAMAESGLVPPLRLVRGVAMTSDVERGFARSRALP